MAAARRGRHHGRHVLLFALSNPEGRIAEHNLDRYELTGKIDRDYLRSLGADAGVSVPDARDTGSAGSTSGARQLCQ